jgi:LmbE family N-acetylglucosaminyl deacetylase
VPSVKLKLLAVHAHPDDEAITTGGVLARYSAEGVRTVVVTLTTGDMGEMRDDRVAARGSLADVRAAELEAAAARLGVHRLVQLGYGDSGMFGWPANNRPGCLWATPTEVVAARLAEVLREEWPDVVIGYDDTGGYGHPDHVKVHHVTRAAVQAAGVARKLYEVVFPRLHAGRFARALREVGIDAPSSAVTGATAGPETTSIGVSQHRVTAAVDVSAYVETKQAALACHRSQMPPEHWLMRMPPDLARRLWRHEHFHRVHGPGRPREDDLFADLA